MPPKYRASQVDIEFGDSQQEGKHMVGLVLRAPDNLQANRLVLFIVVVIGRESV